MSSKKTSAKASAYVHVPRVASFTVTKSKGTRTFTAVNKRAKKIAVKCGKRTKVTAKQLKEFNGYYKLCAYTPQGNLVAIKL